MEQKQLHQRFLPAQGSTAFREAENDLKHFLPEQSSTAIRGTPCVAAATSDTAKSTNYWVFRTFSPREKRTESIWHMSAHRPAHPRPPTGVAYEVEYVEHDGARWGCR